MSSNGTDSSSNNSQTPSKSTSQKVLPTVPSPSSAGSRSRTTIRPLPSSSGMGSKGSKGSLPLLPTQDNLGANTHHLVSVNKTPLDYDQFSQVMTTSPRFVLLLTM